MVASSGSAVLEQPIYIFRVSPKTVSVYGGPPDPRENFSLLQTKGDTDIPALPTAPVRVTLFLTIPKDVSDVSIEISVYSRNGGQIGPFDAFMHVVR